MLGDIAFNLAPTTVLACFTRSALTSIFMIAVATFPVVLKRGGHEYPKQCLAYLSVKHV
jgi:hypothetical protein